MRAAPIRPALAAACALAAALASASAAADAAAGADASAAADAPAATPSAAPRPPAPRPSADPYHRAAERAARRAAGQDAAGPVPARRLTTAEEQADWTAVGRVNAGGQGFCTGTLISDRHVLTAAHCVVNSRTGARWRPTAVHFVAGYRMGEHAAHRTAVAIALPEHGRALRPGARAELARVGQDLAVLLLGRPITAQEATPIPLAAPFGAGPRSVRLYSYGRDRPEALSVQERCEIDARRGDVLFTACEATPGVSGAPIIAPGPDGGLAGARVLGVVSVMGRSGPVEAGAAPGVGDAIAAAADRVAPALVRRLEEGALER